MKRNLLILALFLMGMSNAIAQIVTIDGIGELNEELNMMEITITEAEEDPLTGDMVMGVSGSLLFSDSLKVYIVRSATGLTDEFCCAGQCTAGNGGQVEELVFRPAGLANWYVHYTPQPDTDVKTTYVFSGNQGQGMRTLIVNYKYHPQGIETIRSDEKGVKKIVRDGIVYIIKDNKQYAL